MSGGGKPTMSERMLLVENWQGRHEKDCADRWGLLIKMIGWGGSLAFMTTLGLASWGLNRLYEGQQAQNQVLRELMSRPAASALPHQP